jgi:hypothetical protein
MPERFPTTGYGKGFASRVSKFKQYQDNLEDIFKKKPKKKKKKK